MQLFQDSLFQNNKGLKPFSLQQTLQNHGGSSVNKPSKPCSNSIFDGYNKQNNCLQQPSKSTMSAMSGLTLPLPPNGCAPQKAPQPGLLQDDRFQSYKNKSLPGLLTDDRFQTLKNMKFPPLFSSKDKGNGQLLSEKENPMYKKPNDGNPHDTIAIVDAFNDENDEVCMTLDSTGAKMAHGNFVSALLESQLDENGLGYKVDKLGVDIVDKKMVGGEEQMDYILQNIGQYRAVNVSICEYADYDLLTSAMGAQIAPENLEENKSAIMQMLMSDVVTEAWKYNKETLDAGDTPDLSEFSEEEAKQMQSILVLRNKIENVKDFYQKADKIAQSGVPVFMAGGNDPNKFNLGALLTEKVEYVGAYNSDWENPYTDSQGSFSQNTLNTRLGQETYAGNNVVNGMLDVDDNGSGDICASNIDTGTFYATGTSFASPYALVQALAQADRMYYPLEQPYGKNAYTKYGFNCYT